VRALVVAELGKQPEGRDVPEPVRGSGEALLEMLAASINPVDLGVASGRFFAGAPPVPYVAGAEGVGRVLEADRHPRGAIVWTGMQGLGISRDGVIAERAVAREDGIVRVPDGADPAVASALGIAGLAGWLPLAWRAPVRPGDRVLVLGATGTLGYVAVQAARLLGAERVVAAGRREAGLERARAAGADGTVRLDEPGDLAGRLRAAFGGEGPTLVVDPLWGEPAVAALEAAAPGARILQIGQSAGPVAPVPSGAVRGKALDVLGYTNLHVPFDVLADGYRTLVEHAGAGRIAVDVERVPLDGAVEAWARQAAGTDTKLIIELGRE
jgi:NADPH2:quinone reductase